MVGVSGRRVAFAVACAVLAGCARPAEPGDADSAILNELNRLRADPPAYANRLSRWRAYFHGRILALPGQGQIQTVEGVAALDEALRALQSAKPCPPLILSRGLTRAAKDHVRDIGPKGLVSHDGTDGSRPADRDRRYVRSIGVVAECISFGPRDPANVIGQLILDDGVRNRAHRHILLDARLGAAGVACGPHARYGWMCVIDLAGGVAER